MAFRKIHVEGNYKLTGQPATTTIKPGMLLETTSTMGVQPFSSQGGFHEKHIAMEDALQGKTIDDAYAASDPVYGAIAEKGSVFLMILKAGENVAIGDKIISNNAGLVIKTTGSPSQIVGYAMEAKNLSASGSVDTRIQVRIA